jgi:hypothetical protein
VDQLKAKFTSNFMGTMGRLGTRMDLVMVKREQGEMLHHYMHYFFNKCATIDDVTDKEVIDLFQDSLYHHRTFEDFDRRRPISITKLKDMITSWGVEEDKMNARYDSIRGKSKNNTGGNNNNNDQGAATTTQDLTTSASQKTQSRLRPVKDSSKKTSGALRDFLKEKCTWHLEGNHMIDQCYQPQRALKD